MFVVRRNGYQEVRVINMESVPCVRTCKVPKKWGLILVRECGVVLYHLGEIRLRSGASLLLVYVTGRPVTTCYWGLLIMERCI